MCFQTSFLFVLFLILSVSDAVGHTDHGVGGERIRFDPIPPVAKPVRVSDRVLGFAPPPWIAVERVFYDLSEGLSVSSWIFKDSSVTANPVVTQWEQAPGSGSFALFGNGGPGGGFQLRWEDGSVAEVSGYEVPVRRWLHYVATYDGKTADVFVDGKRVTSATFDPKVIASCSNPLLIGNSDRVANTPFAGMIDDVRIWERGLSAEEVKNLFEGVLPAKVASSWTFEEDERGAAALSISKGVVLVADPSGRRGKVVRFPWEPYVEVDPDSAKPVNTEVTVAAWVYNRGIRRLGGPIVGNWGPNLEDRSFVLYSVGGDGFGFRAFWQDGTQNNLTVVEMPSEEWFHCAATYDGREMRLYVNGVLSGRTIVVDKTFTKTKTRTWIGGLGTQGENSFQGYLDEVGIWSRSLHQDEIKRVLKDGAVPGEHGLVHWSTFDQPQQGQDVTFASPELRDPTLQEAAAAGDLDRTRKAVALANPDRVNEAFWWATSHGRLDAGRFLLSSGADINAKLGLGGYTALHAAVQDRRIETVQFLIDMGADVNLPDDTYGSSAWGWAGRLGYAVLRSYLLDTASETNLYAAIEHDAPEQAEGLLAAGLGNWNLNRALRQAASLGRPELLEMLLAEGADPDKRDVGGRSAHDLAVVQSRYESVDVLRERAGLDVSGGARYLARIEELDEAIESGDLDRIESVLKTDPDLIRSDPQGDRTWLQQAASQGNAKVARFLISKGASFERVRNSHTALSWAVTIGAKSVAEEILGGGENLDLFAAAGLGRLSGVRGYFSDDGLVADASRTGSTRLDTNREEIRKPPENDADRISDALYVAARNGHLQTVVFLLGKGADPDFRAARGGTPIYWAVRKGHLLTVEALLQAGGNASIPDRYGRNALQIALRSKNEKLRKLLKVE